MRTREVGEKRGGAMRRAGRWFGAAVAAGAPAAGHAQEVQTGMLVSLGVRADNNPFNQISTNRVSIAGTTELRPQLSLRTPKSTVSVVGLAQFRQYTNGLGLEDNYSANANLVTRPSNRLTVTAGLGVASTELGGNFGRIGALPLVPITPLTPIGTTPTTPPLDVVPNLPLIGLNGLITDPALFGFRSRTTTYNANVGWSSVLGSRTRLSTSGRFNALRTRQLGFADSNTAAAEAQLSQGLSERVSVGVIGSVGRSNFLRTRVGDASFASALLSVDYRLSARLALSGAAGVSITNVRQLPGLPSASLTALNVRGSLCRVGELTRVCVTGQRSPQPSAIGAVFITDSIGVDASTRLSERESVGVGGTYTRNSAGGLVVGPRLPTASVIGATARYNNRLRERLSAYATANFNRFSGNGTPGRSNIGGEVGLQYRFGGRR